MELNEKVKVLFKNSNGDETSITITVLELIRNTDDDLYELLDGSIPCTSSGCNNESQNFCDCESHFEDYEIYGIEKI